MLKINPFCENHVKFPSCIELMRSLKMSGDHIILFRNYFLVKFSLCAIVQAYELVTRGKKTLLKQSLKCTAKYNGGPHKHRRLISTFSLLVKLYIKKLPYKTSCKRI